MCWNSASSARSLDPRAIARLDVVAQGERVHRVDLQRRRRDGGARGSFDFLLDSVSAEHAVSAYLALLKADGNLTMVGASEKPLSVPAFGLIFGRKSLSGSSIGGIAQTQEMLDFCGEHNIVADVEVIPIGRIDEAYERMLRSDVKYRFSIDMASWKAESPRCGRSIAERRP